MARSKISGLDALNRKLTRLPTEVQRDVKAAMARGADQIVTLAKSLAPVGQATGPNSSNNPGALRDSIGWTWGDKAPKGSIKLGNVLSRSGRSDHDLVITIYAGDDKAFYARWVEFGTKSHSIDAVNQPTMGRGGRNFGTHVDHPGANATPFFYPAYRAERRRVKSNISRAVNSAARRVSRS